MKRILTVVFVGLSGLLAGCSILYPFEEPALGGWGGELRQRGRGSGGGL